LNAATGPEALDVLLVVDAAQSNEQSVKKLIAGPSRLQSATKCIGPVPSRILDEYTGSRDAAARMASDSFAREEACPDRITPSDLPTENLLRPAQGPERNLRRKSSESGCQKSIDILRKAARSAQATDRRRAGHLFFPGQAAWDSFLLTGRSTPSSRATRYSLPDPFVGATRRTLAAASRSCEPKLAGADAC
jgi:hypothetical protein